MITIVPYDPAWPALFEVEAASIRQHLGELAVRVEHVGSTSVSGLAAKAVVDIQVSVASLEPMDTFLQGLARIGYRHVPLGPVDAVYPFFQKPAEGPGTHHIHLCAADSEQERRHLAFRDHLRHHPSVAAEYVALKRRLASIHHGSTLESRERYSLAKTEFVASVLSRAADCSPDPACPGDMRTLASGDLALEPQLAAHAEEMFAVLSDPALYQYENEPPPSVDWLHTRFTKLESRHSGDGTEQWLNWVIRVAGTELVGYVQATVRADGRAFIAYVLRSSSWGKGYAMRAVEAMIDELVARYGVHTVLAIFKEPNLRSRRLLERLAFVAAPPEWLALHSVEPDESLMYRRADRA